MHVNMSFREDRELNTQRAPATKKISMLSIVMTQLRKADLQASVTQSINLSRRASEASEPSV